LNNNIDVESERIVSIEKRIRLAGPLIINVVSKENNNNNNNKNGNEVLISSKNRNNIINTFHN
jgi:hypothetical protein